MPGRSPLEDIYGGTRLGSQEPDEPNVRALQGQVQELEAALDRVRGLHTQDASRLDPGAWCPGCGDRVPCATIRAVRGTI